MQQNYLVKEHFVGSELPTLGYGQKTFQFAWVLCYDLKEKLTSCLLMGHELSAKNNRNKDLMRHTPYYKENKEEHYIKIHNNCSLDKNNITTVHTAFT